MLRLHLLEAAVEELERLDRAVGARILKRLRWLAENFESVRPQALEGHLAGLFKFRVGDYRVIYEILAAERTLVVHAIGHRREIYR
ncbi:MAG TPA: type II toxin-antitoxin system RelE/ParE family toxin [Thermoanaerobaculia bacterium]|jgi:mRNA interferase RelE/StbE